MTLFEPSPVLLAFIFVQRFVYFEVLGLLALLRVIIGLGAARVPAGLTLLVCITAIFTTFAPALNLQGTPFYPDVARLLALGGGMVLPLLTSVLFAVSLLIPTRRWRWIDIAHLIGVVAFLGLWIMTRI